MKNKKWFWLGFFTLATCFLFSFLLFGKLIIEFNERQFYKRMAVIISEVSEPSKVIRALKEPSEDAGKTGEATLKKYGYHRKLLTEQERGILLLFAALAAMILFTLYACLFLYQRKQMKKRIADLTGYLKLSNAGKYPLRPYLREDSFSLLEDELYKTVTALRESRNEALLTKENLAKNMADISHQLKTPLTSLSLMAELVHGHMEESEDKHIMEQILAQTDRLSSLTAALLTLSRMDAGVFELNQTKTMAEELISCAAEPVLALLEKKRQNLLVQGDLEVSFLCDIRWTAEGIGNIIKNCSEHAPEGSSISVTVRQNPVFTEIVIEDNGDGFDERELHRIFERFYKGRHSIAGSIGIGLPLAKSIVEKQNGEILAENRKEGGARFQIKFYRF